MEVVYQPARGALRCVDRAAGGKHHEAATTQFSLEINSHSRQFSDGPFYLVSRFVTRIALYCSIFFLPLQMAFEYRDSEVGRNGAGAEPGYASDC